MDRRTLGNSRDYSREAGTERRALRARGDRRRHASALRMLFIPLGLLVRKLRTFDLAI